MMLGRGENGGRIGNGLGIALLFCVTNKGRRERNQRPNLQGGKSIPEENIVKNHLNFYPLRFGMNLDFSLLVE
jgi:hypothetical protein